MRNTIAQALVELAERCVELRQLALKNEDERDEARGTLAHARDEMRASSELVAEARELLLAKENERAALAAELAEREKIEAAVEPDVTRAVKKFTALVDELQAVREWTSKESRPGTDLQRFAFHSALSTHGAREGEWVDWCERVALTAVARFAAKLLESIEERLDAEIAPDPYWAEHRERYAKVSDLFNRLSRAQHALVVAARRSRDWLREGITLESTDNEFPRAARLAEQIFPGYEPFSRVQIEPDPWKSPGAWQISANGARNAISGYAWDRDIEKHFGGGA